MNSEPALSIMTPIYNGSDFVFRCYKNLLSQTLTNWEWVVVDDGSTDRTSEIVQNIDDSRIRLIRYQQNRGRGYARTVAINESKGDWIVIWDVDDLHFPERLESIDRARLQGYDFFCSYAVVVNNRMGIKSIRGFGKPSGCLGRGYVHPTLALKKELAKSIGYTITCGVGGIGEDVKISWVLPLKYKGMWFEDALTIYQEDREVNLKKSIDSNIAQLGMLRELMSDGLIYNERKYFVSSLKYLMKIFVLNIARVYPYIYKNSVSLRSYGQLRNGWKLSQSKIEYLEQISLTKQHNSEF